MAQKAAINRTFLSAVIILVFFVFFSGSSLASTTWLTSIPGTQDDVPTRIALDQEGNIYVTQPRTRDNLLIYNRHGVLSRTLYGLSGPIGVAVDSSGKIYIGNDKTDSIDVYNNDLSFSHRLGKGKGDIKNPNAIAISAAGQIYATDTKNHNVRAYNPDGSSAFTIGKWGKGNGEFNFPLGIAIDQIKAELYVTDLGIYTDPTNGNTSGARVQVFDLNGVYKRSFGEYGLGEGRLFRPLGIAIDEESKLYITDSYQAMVQVFDGNGKFIEAIYDTAHPMETPIGIAVGKDKRIFVASSNGPSLEIYGLPGYVTMATSPSALTYEAEQGATPAKQDITITNSGEGDLNWTASSDSVWITLSQTTGVTPAKASTALSVGIDITGLAAGAYTGQIKITAASGAKDTITVNLTVTTPPSILSVKPSALSFKAQKEGPNPASQKLTIENQGTGEMPWQAEAAQTTWLSLNQTEGQAPSTITVNASNAGLKEGTYTGVITISAPGAQGSPANINVSLKVINAGTLKVTSNISQASFDIIGTAITYSGQGTEWINDEVPPGDYTITFKHITGYIKPLAQTFTVVTGKETQINGQYRTKPIATHIIAGSGGTKGKKVEVLTPSGEIVTSFEPFTGPVSTKVAAGDIDGTGIDKIAVTDHKKTIKIYTHEGTELASKELAEGYTNSEIAASDIDNDAIAEIILGVKNETDSQNIQREIKLFKYKNGKLQEESTLYKEPKEKEFSIALGDIDGDGKVELLIADSDGLRAFGIDLKAETKLNLLWANAGAYKNVPQIAAGDINDDGKAEIALSTETESEKGKTKTSGIIKILTGEGKDYKQGDTSLTIEPFKDLGYEKPATVALGDIDGDGVDEVAAGAGADEKNDGLIRLYESDGKYTGVSIKAMEDKFGVNVGLGRFR